MSQGQTFQPVIAAGQDQHAHQGKGAAQRQPPAGACRQRGAARAAGHAAQSIAQAQQRPGRAQGENAHRQDGEEQAAASRGEHEGRRQRRPGAGRPEQREKRARRRLPEQSGIAAIWFAANRPVFAAAPAPPRADGPKSASRSARPMSRISTAAKSRNQPESPKSTPNDARNPPTTPKVTAMPAARARGPRGFSARAPATTTGTSGRTQGLSIVITPAKKDKGRVQSEITAPPSSGPWRHPPGTGPRIHARLPCRRDRRSRSSAGRSACSPRPFAHRNRCEKTKYSCNSACP